MKKKCITCGHTTYPLKDEQGKLIWRNLFRMDMLSLMFLISILLILLGMNQINKQCFDYMEDPCGVAESIGCKYSASNILEQNNATLQTIYGPTSTG